MDVTKKVFAAKGIELASKGNKDGLTRQLAEQPADVQQAVLTAWALKASSSKAAASSRDQRNVLDWRNLVTVVGPAPGAGTSVPTAAAPTATASTAPSDRPRANRHAFASAAGGRAAQRRHVTAM